MEGEGGSRERKMSIRWIMVMVMMLMMEKKEGKKDLFNPSP